MGATNPNQAQLEEMAIGNAMGSFKRGGKVKKTGRYLVHKGERVEKGRKKERSDRRT